MHLLYRRVPVDEPAQFVGVHPLHWHNRAEPGAAFVEVESWEPEGAIFLTAKKIAKKPLFVWDGAAFAWRCCFCLTAFEHDDLGQIEDENNHPEHCSWRVLRESFNELACPSEQEEE